MRYSVDPRQGRLYDTFDGIIPPLGRDRIDQGWQSFFRIRFSRSCSFLNSAHTSIPLSAATPRNSIPLPDCSFSRKCTTGPTQKQSKPTSFVPMCSNLSIWNRAAMRCANALWNTIAPTSLRTNRPLRPWTPSPTS